MDRPGGTGVLLPLLLEIYVIAVLALLVAVWIGYK